MNSKHLLFSLSLLVLNLIWAPSARAGTTVLWEASSGIPPNLDNPSWTLLDTATPEDPVLSAGFITLETSDDSEVMFYSQLEPDIAIGHPLIIEVRMRLLSGTSSSLSRAPAVVTFSTAVNVGNALQIGVGEIFVNDANLAKGQSASVDTSAFHTYRIEIEASGDFTVFYDGVPTLSGQEFTNAAFNGPTPRIVWGMGSTLSHGEAEWVYAEHNAGLPAVPTLGGLGLVVLAGALVTLGGIASAKRTLLD